MDYSSEILGQTAPTSMDLITRERELVSEPWRPLDPYQGPHASTTPAIVATSTDKIFHGLQTSAEPPPGALLPLAALAAGAFFLLK